MIYDVTQINDELDMLELRLNILDPYVDRFVIGESRQTFSGKPKELYYHDNRERFSRWAHKITHIQLPEITTNDVFKRTSLQKDYLRKVFEYFLLPLQDNDVIYYGDVDEIWTPQTEEGKLKQLAYSYYLNQRSSEDWQGTNRVLYKNIKNLNELRADHSNIIENGGWHFTNMGGIEQIRNKIKAYDHQEVNIPWVHDGLEARFESGQDYLGRTHDWKGNEFRMWIDESEWPQYLKDNKDKYKHLCK